MVDLYHGMRQLVVYCSPREIPSMYYCFYGRPISYLFLLAVSTVFVFLLGGCSSSERHTSSKFPENFAERRWVIGFSNASESNTWRTALRESIEKTVAKYDNVDLLITDANDSPAKQVADLEDLLAKGVDGLIIGAVNTHAANTAIAECEQMGVPTVVVDRAVSGDKFTTFVSTDHRWLAATGLEQLIKLVGGSGKIAIIEGLPGAGAAVERNKGYDDVLPRYPKINAVRQAGDWSRASGQRVTENVLTANPDLLGIHFDGGEMAVGGVQALRTSGFTDEELRSGKPFLTWTDGYNGGLKLIKAGIGKFSVQHPPRIHGELSVESLIKIFKGGEVPKQQPIRLDFITPENVDEYVDMDQPDAYWAF